MSVTVYPIRGMRGVGNFTATDRPQSWREKMMELFPNGSVSLTALTGMMGRGKYINDERHNWKTRQLQEQAGAITGVYIDTLLATPYVYASHQSTYGIANAVVNVKVALATAQQIREGHQVALCDTDHPDAEVQGKVVAVHQNAASSYVAVKLLEADDNDTSYATYNLATVDRIRVIGNINAQGGARPPRIAYNPSDLYNLTHIWRTPLSITRTASKTRLRGRDAYLDDKEQGLLYHGIEMEKDLIWSILTQNTNASNGEHENTIMGIKQFIATYASDNMSNFALNTSYSGKKWTEAGEDWFDEMMEKIFRWGNGDLGGDVFAYCGGGAARGIQRLIKAGANYQIQGGLMSYGIKVRRWETIFGTLNLMIHPLFSMDAYLTNTMLIVTPSSITWLPIEDGDTDFYEDPRRTRKEKSSGIDGFEEEYLTEGTYEYRLDAPFGYLNGVGNDNAV